MRNQLRELFLDGQDLLETGKTNPAIKVYVRALKESEKGTEEEYLALTYLGMAYDEAGQEAKAIDCFQKSLDIASKVYGATSLQYAAALSNAGMVNSNRGRVTVAEPLLDKAVQIILAASKSQDPSPTDPISCSAIEIYSNAADCKAKLGKAEQSLEFMQQAHKASISTLNQNHPRRIQTALELGVLYSALGRAQEAENLKEEFFAGVKKAGINRSNAMSMFMEATTNALTIVKAIEEQQPVLLGNLNGNTITASS